MDPRDNQIFGGRTPAPVYQIRARDLRALTEDNVHKVKHRPVGQIEYLYQNGMSGPRNRAEWRWKLARSREAQ